MTHVPCYVILMLEEVYYPSAIANRYAQAINFDPSQGIHGDNQGNLILPFNKDANNPLCYGYY